MIYITSLSNKHHYLQFTLDTYLQHHYYHSQIKNKMKNNQELQADVQDAIK